MHYVPPDCLSLLICVDLLVSPLAAMYVTGGGGKYMADPLIVTPI